MAGTGDLQLERIEHLTMLSKAKGFLGREFLTWLWYVAETTTERQRLTWRGRTLEFDLWIDDRLVLDGATALSHQHTMKGGDPSRSREAAACLATGKTLREAKIGMSIRGFGDYSAVLAESDLSPRSLKLPEPESEDDSPGRARVMPLAARLEALAAFLAVLDGLVGRFLEARVSPNWEDEGLRAMREWIARRDEQAATIH